MNESIKGFILNKFNINDIKIPSKLDCNNILITNSILKTWNLKNVRHILCLYPQILFNSILIKSDLYDSVFIYNNSYIYITNYYTFIKNRKNIDVEQNYVLIFCNSISKIKEHNTEYKKFIKLNVYNAYKELANLMNKNYLNLSISLNYYNLNLKDLNDNISKLKLLCKNVYNNIDKIKEMLNNIIPVYIYNLCLENINFINNSLLESYIKNMFYYRHDEILYIKNNKIFMEPYLVLFITILYYIFM